MEKLRTYLIGRRKGDFATALGISPAYLSQILSGHRNPSLDMMRRIEAATDGLVDLNAWAVPVREAS